MTDKNKRFLQKVSTLQSYVPHSFVAKMMPKNNEGNDGDSKFVKLGNKLYQVIKNKKRWEKQEIGVTGTTTAATTTSTSGSGTGTTTYNHVINLTATYTQESAGPRITLNWTYTSTDTNFNSNGVINFKIKRKRSTLGVMPSEYTHILNSSGNFISITGNENTIHSSSNMSPTFSDDSVENSGTVFQYEYQYEISAFYGSDAMQPDSILEGTAEATNYGPVPFYRQRIQYTENSGTYGISDGDIVTGLWSNGNLVACATAANTPTSLDITGGNVAYNVLSQTSTSLYGNFALHNLSTGKKLYTNSSYSSLYTQSSTYSRLGLKGVAPTFYIFKTDSSGNIDYLRDAKPANITSVALQGSAQNTSLTIRITADTVTTSNFTVYKKVNGTSNYDAGTTFTPSASGNTSNTAVATDCQLTGLAQLTRYDVKVVANGQGTSQEFEYSNASLTTTGAQAPTISVDDNNVVETKSTSGTYYSDVITMTVTNGVGSIYVQKFPISNNYEDCKIRVASSATDKITSGGTWITVSEFAQQTTLTPSSGTLYLQFRGSISYKAATDTYYASQTKFTFRETTTGGTATQDVYAGFIWQVVQP
jgi:hypothetical protein